MWFYGARFTRCFFLGGSQVAWANRSGVLRSVPTSTEHAVWTFTNGACTLPGVSSRGSSNTQLTVGSVGLRVEHSSNWAPNANPGMDENSPQSKVRC